MRWTDGGESSDIEDRRDEYAHAGAYEIPIDRRDNGVEAREQAPRRQQVRQQVNALAAGTRIFLGLGRHGDNLSRHLLLRCPTSARNASEP